ncbi:MAG: ferredoxin:glutaredoxin reductase [Methanobacteriaceae archaeon]|nr:ferredoxin:glutaredoxin reductase [Candidatus Methanorudis spinitermitis]
MGKAYEKFKNEAEETGYNVSPDVEFVEMLLENIQVNIERYGYGACPCRLASGNREEDLDLICPCDYRDADLEDYGACFCALYVTPDILEGKKKLSSIPDRRLEELEAKKSEKKQEIPAKDVFGKLKYPIYRCIVCGYLCCREKPPVKCPICKVSADRFEIIL